MIALSLPLVFSAIRATLRYRDRVDRVLSLATAAQGLPFALPPMPVDMKPFREEMRAFFRSGEGLTILVLHGLAERFAQLDAQLTGGQGITDPTLLQSFDQCTELYRRARSIGPFLLQPELKDPAMLARYAATGPGDDARLAYFVVESDRLSRNTTLARLVLTTVDTLLEYLGENANTFIANPRTRGWVEGVVQAFAGQDFDDTSVRDLFRDLLAAGVASLLDQTQSLPLKPWVAALCSAINETRRELAQQANGDGARAYDALMRLFGEQGLERLANSLVVRAAEQTALSTDSDLLRRVLRAGLQEIARARDAQGGFVDLFANEAARHRVLEALIEAGLGGTQGVLARIAADGRPFSAAVLTALVDAVRTEAANRQLFAEIAQGEIAGELYAVALAAIATNGQALANESGIPALVADLVAALAAELSAAPSVGKLERVARNRLVAAALEVLAQHAQVLVAEHNYASPIVAAVVDAAAAGAADGFTATDLQQVLGAALQTLVDHVRLALLNKAQAAALAALTAALAGAPAGVRKAAARRALLMSVLTAVAANPKILADATALQRLPMLAKAVLTAMLQAQARELLSDSDVLAGFDAVLLSASRRVRVFIERAEAIADLEALLRQSLTLIEQELGRSIDQPLLPRALEQVAQAYCKAPFVLAVASAQQLQEFFDAIRSWLEQQ